MNKYHAKKCIADGIPFDSQLERDTYLELVRLHDIGIIKGVVHQRRYLLRSHSGIVIGTYVADFRCLLASGKVAVVEAKGYETAIWRRTKAHFLADYPQVHLVVVTGHSQFPLELTCNIFAPDKGKNYGFSNGRANGSTARNATRTRATSIG